MAYYQKGYTVKIDRAKREFAVFRRSNDYNDEMASGNYELYDAADNTITVCITENPNNLNEGLVRNLVADLYRAVPTFDRSSPLSQLATSDFMDRTTFKNKYVTKKTPKSELERTPAQIVQEWLLMDKHDADSLSHISQKYNLGGFDYTEKAPTIGQLLKAYIMMKDRWADNMVRTKEKESA